MEFCNCCKDDNIYLCLQGTTVGYCATCGDTQTKIPAGICSKHYVSKDEPCFDCIKFMNCKHGTDSYICDNCYNTALESCTHPFIYVHIE